MLSQGTLVSSGISSGASLGVKLGTQLSTTMSTVDAQGSSLQLPDILIDFGTTNITSLGQLQCAFDDMFIRAAAIAGLTR